MGRRRGCSLVVLGTLFVLVACLVYAVLAATVVLRGEIPLYPPRVTALEPVPGDAYLPTTQIVLSFDQPMDQGSAEAAFSIEPLIPGTFSWNEDRTQLTFLPAGSGYEPGSRYTARFDSGALAATLPRRTARSLEWSFSLPSLVDRVQPPPGMGGLGAQPEVQVDFNYALGCPATVRTFSVEPDAVGVLRCRDSNLVFTPTLPLEPGTEYEATLAHVFLEGDATPRPGVEWRFSTAPPLAVLDWEPISAGFLIDLTSPVRIRFNRPVYPASMVSRFSLRTGEGEDVPGQVTWESGGATFVFQPAEPLRPGIAYEIQLRQGVRDELGFELQAPLRASFDTLQMMGPPMPLPGARQVPLESQVRVPFTRPMDKASVEAGLAIIPAIEHEITWEEDTLVLVPRGGLAPETLYEVMVGADVRDATGAPLSRPGRWAFETEPFLLEMEGPSGPEISELGQPITFTFALPMDQDNVEAALTISPTTPGRLYWSDDGQSVSFQPEPGWQAGADYRLALSATARTADGWQTLGQDLVRTFSTAAAEVQFGEGPNVQVLPATGERSLQILFQGADLADLVLYPIAPTELLDFYRSGFVGMDPQSARMATTAGLTPTVEWRAPLVPVEGNVSEPGWQQAEVNLPPDVSEGIYLLSALPQAGENGTLLVVLTGHALVAKRALAGLVDAAGAAAAEGVAAETAQVVVWDTTLPGGAPVVSATVRLYDPGGVLLAEGQTDAQGLYEARVPGDPGPLLIVSEKDGDVSVCGLGDEWGESGWWGWRPSSPIRPLHKVYAYTDRPIYRPGQAVHFKAFLRMDDDAAYSLPPQDLPVTVRLRDARDNIAATRVLTPTEFGTIYGQFELAGEAMLGTWHIESVARGTRSWLPFEVEEYRRPEYAVAVDTPQAVYVQGEAISLTVEASYYSGQPVAGADLALNVYPAYEFDTAEGIELGFGPPILAGTGTTDAGGRWRSSLDVGDIFGPSAPKDRILLALEATVTDETARAVSSYRLVTLRRAALDLSLALDTYGYAPGREFVFAGEVRDRDGEPAPGVAVTGQVLGWDDHLVSEAAATTGASGRAVFSEVLEEEGWYQLRLSATDSEGRAIEAQEWIWVLEAEDQANWFQDQVSPEDQLRLRLDRASYTPGDEAQLAIEAPAGGPALLTFERGETRRMQVVALSPGTNLITVPVRSDDVPNVYVTLSQFGSLGPDAWAGQSRPSAELHTARAELRVPAAGKALTVTLAPDEDALHPGDETIIDVNVSDQDGRPVKAEVSLVVVDEAMYALALDLGEDPFQAFYSPRPNLVSTFDSLRPFRWLFPGGQGTGGDDDVPGQPRRDFLDAALWLPAVVTGDDGRAQVTLTLPDDLTGWRILARAVTTDTKVGQAIASLITAQDIVVRPGLPRFLMQGDVLTVTAAVHNFTSLPVSATVSLEAEGLTPRGLAGEQMVHVPAGAAATAAWPVQVDAHSTQARVGLRAAATYRGARLAGRDAIDSLLPVIPLATNEVASFAGELGPQQPQQVLTVTLPADAIEGLSRLEFDVAPSLAAGLTDGLQYLIDYPYGCVEQTLSRVLSNAVVAQVFSRLGIQNARVEVDLQPMARLSLQRLYGFQHADGGWGWWYDDITDVHQTAYVLLGLAISQEAGFEVDGGVLERGARALAGMMPGADPEAQAYGAYALAMAGEPLTLTISITEALDLEPFYQAALALALDSAGEASLVEALLDELRGAAVQDEAGIRWPAVGEASQLQATMSSDVRTTAMVLDALVRLDPASPLLPGAVRWLMDQRQGEGWGDTQRTSFAILALVDYQLATEELAAGASYRVHINDQAWIEGQLLSPDQAQSWVLTYTQAVSPALLLPGENTVRVELLPDAQAPAGRLYYRVVLDVLQPAEETPLALKAHERSIAIERSYRLAGTQEPATGFQQGDLVEIQLTLDVPVESWYVIVDDPLPAGLEALNEKLGVTSHAVSAYENPLLHWQQYGYNRKEVRDRRVTFFATQLEPGEHSFTYLARATVAGVFSALPAQAYPMYEPEVWSRSAGMRIHIAPRER
jgi:alpha-2-macroglobulin